MKRIDLIALLVLCMCCTAAKAQYIVTKVSGKIKTGNGNYVRPGSQLKADEPLSWTSVNDKLWVVIPGKGEKIISLPPGSVPSADNLIVQVLLTALHQNSTSGSLTGRGEIIERIPDALHTDVKSNGKIIMEQENKFLFDPKIYPQGDGNVFFIEIDAPRQSPVIHTLKTVLDTVYINQTDYATESYEPGAKYSIGYHSKAGGSTLVTTFSPYFDQSAEMEGIIANTILAYQGVSNSKDVVRDSVYRSVYASTGKPNGILFTALFDKYWQSKGVINTDLPDGGKGLIFNQNEFNNIPQLSASIEVTRGDLPPNFSLWQYAPPVGDQKRTSSCTAWSTAYACRTISYAVQHNYSVSNQYDKILSYTFAPDFIYNNIKTTPDCNYGTAVYDALNFMKTKGVILKASDFECGKTYTPTDLTEAGDYKIKDFYTLNGRNISKEALIQRMKSAIASKHALPFGMDISTAFSNVGPSGIWYPTANERISVNQIKRNVTPMVPLYGHAMCVIGYDDAVNNGSFQIMNSWGAAYGKKGFWWINYDDFYDFVEDVYSMADFEASAPPPVPQPVTPVKIEAPVIIKPVVVVPKPNIPPPVVSSKPKLKGALEFMLLKPDNSFENIAVNKTQLTTRGQMVEGDHTDSLTYANFVLAKHFHSRNQYKIKFNLAQPAYVYVIGMDKQSNYTLFPQKKLNESALININNATLFLPNNTSSYTLDNVTGKEKMCILVSKSPIDIDMLNQQFVANNNNFYQAIRKTLAKRLLEMKLVNFTTNKISFDTEVNDTNVLAFFVEMNHIQ